MGLDELTRDKTSRGWLILLIGISLVLVLLATALLFLLVINEFTVELQMNGPGEITLEYGDTYEEAGAEAVLRGSMVFTEGFELEVQTDGKVPPLCLGAFPVTYSAALGPWHGSVTRIVRVVDTQPPEITLFTNEAVYTRPGQEYREEGYLAVDNYDGDITDLVQVTVGDGTVTYTVTDSSGNSAVIIRRIRYGGAE